MVNPVFACIAGAAAFVLWAPEELFVGVGEGVFPTGPVSVVVCFAAADVADRNLSIIN